MKYLKLYEEYNSSNPNGIKKGFKHSKYDITKFLKNNNINPEYTDIYTDTNGDICIEINYQLWYDDDVKDITTMVEEDIENELEEYKNSSELYDELYEMTSDMVSDDEVEDTMRYDYPELMPPDSDDFENYQKYEKAYSKWEKNHKDEYDDKFQEVKDELRYQHEDDCYIELIDDKERLLYTTLDERVDYVIDDRWGYKENGRAEVIINNYFPNSKGYLPCKIIMVDPGVNTNYETEFIINDLISTDGIEEYQGPEKYIIDSEYIADISNLDGYYVDSVRNSIIFSKDCIPKESTIDIESQINWSGGTEEESILEFIDTIINYDSYYFECIILELLGKKPELIEKIKSVDGNDTVMSYLDRLQNASQHKDIINL